MSQSKFKVGDLVRRIRDCEDEQVVGAYGQIGRVLEVTKTGSLLVEYQDPDFNRQWLKYMGSHMKTPFSYFTHHHAGFTVKLAAPVFTNVDDAIAEATRISAITGTPCEVIAA